MIIIPKIKEDQLYSIEWCIPEIDFEGYGVGTFTVIKDNNDEIVYINFKMDGDIYILRIEIKYIISLKEYNYEKINLNKNARL